MKQRAAETIDEIDRLLEDPELDESTVAALVELLTPGESAPWPELEAVLHVAEHDAVASDLRMHAVPDRLERAIGEALEAVLPLLGIRPYGPTFKIAEIARRKFDAESEKFELVSEKIDEISDEEARALVARYLDTSPAPMFVNRMRKLHPSVVEDAADSDLAAAALREFEYCEQLAEILESPEALRQAEATSVGGMLEAPDDPAAVATAALGSDRWRDQLVGGALMGHEHLSDLVSVALRRVTEGSVAAPQLAVFAATTAPERARHALSTFLAEVSWQNPELPEAEWTESRVRAILSSRSVLPRVGSPMEPLDPEKLPALGEHAELRRLPERIDAFWAAWESLLED